MHKSRFHGAVPPTRRLLDGVAVPVPHRSTVHPAHCLICAQATQLNDSFESGLLLSFLEASDKGAIAPSLLSQLVGGDEFRPPPPQPARPSNDTSDWPGAALGGDFGFTDDFNLFGKKMSFSGDDLLGGGYSPGGFNAQPRMQRAGSRD